MKVTCAVFFGIYFISCANQQPPSGGDDDKDAPKILKTSPANNTVMYRGNSIRFYFDEYVNRRSFEDAFRISPLPKGRPKFDWGAKDVEVIYEDGFDKNKTYSIVITKDFKDVNGGNALSSPINLAFSTGDKIDKGSISGKIVADTYDRMLITAYILTSANESFVKPDTLKPDYATQPDENGNYSLMNLPNGKYRLYAFNDDDRNSLYNKDVEKIAVLPSDVIVSDSIRQSGNNFLFKSFETGVIGKEFYQTLKSDSLNIVFTSIDNNASGVPVDSRFYFYFKNKKINKLDIADNLKLTDSSSNANIKLAFNWINDSLLQVFPSENLKQGKSYLFILKTSTLDFRRNFKSVSENQVGTISGSVLIKDTLNTRANIVIQLINKINSSYRYSMNKTGPGVFKFENVPEGEYMLFAFIDMNGSGKYDAGKYYPYEPSEPFFVYDKTLKAKGMWNTDNVNITF
ncbi:MAG: Ig-like domain-containing protein [Bacteroidetes bacterium]|nr:Ig-like domain-containing protein [Bacteroidota bacterium]